MAIKRPKPEEMILAILLGCTTYTGVGYCAILVYDKKRF